MWNSLLSQPAIDQLLHDFGGFHDACLREIPVATENYVSEDLGMSCPSHLDTSVLLSFQRQARPLSAIEIKCEEVTSLHFIPTADGCDSIVWGGTLSLAEGEILLAVNFVGGPMRGPPSGSLTIQSSSDEQPNLLVTAGKAYWRAIEDGLGDALRYRRSEGEAGA